jgi:3-dehydrosphinganine reductase
MKSFTDQLVLITGGSSGIGLAIAKQFVSLGANCYLLSRRVEILEHAKKELEQIKLTPEQQIGILSADLVDDISLNNTLSEFASNVGVPDYLINSAGVAHPGEFSELDMSIFKWMMDVNYFGSVNAIKAFVQPMIERGSGHIINISSAAGFMGVYGYTAYGASKYAVRGLSDALRSELKLHGIDVSIVFPPDTQTPQLIYESQYKPEITKIVAGSAGAMSADAVAKTIMRGIEKKKYIITPGFETSLFYSLSNIVGRGIYPIMDFMVKDAVKKINRKK